MKEPPVLPRWLFLAALALAIGMAFDFAFPRGGRPSGPAELEAMRRFRTAQGVACAERRARVDEATLRELERVDPARSGFVGIEWSPLVSSPGSLDAKQLSCDARWAALFVRWFERAGVRPGSRVAIGASGSFPALLSAAQAAAETLGAEPVIAASLASSNFGATVPAFDLYETHSALREAGVLHAPIALLSPGGDGDRLAGFDEPDAAAVFARLDFIADQPGAPEILLPGNLDESVERRAQVLLRPLPAVYVNIGGHAANYGVGAAALALPPGYIEPRADAARVGGGIALRSLRAGVPVINVLDLRAILLEERAGLSAPPGVLQRAAAGGAALFLAATLLLVRSRRETIRSTTDEGADT